MNKLKHIEIIQNLNFIKNEEIILLDKLLLKFPYYQNGQILLAKGLLNTNSIRYNRQLKKAAAYSSNREKLFKIIISNQESISEKKKENIDVIIENPEILDFDKPLRFDENESHSFSEWLNLIKIQKIDRSNEVLVDNFLQKETKISKPKKETFFKAVDSAKESIIENTDLVTPTLARVYLEQQHYQKAIFTYKKLILKYPKKSSFFAEQIKLISKLNIK